jgi:hypothetical protein
MIQADSVRPALTGTLNAKITPRRNAPSLVSQDSVLFGRKQNTKEQPQADKPEAQNKKDGAAAKVAAGILGTLLLLQVVNGIMQVKNAFDPKYNAIPPEYWQTTPTPSPTTVPLPPDNVNSSDNSN